MIDIISIYRKNMKKCWSQSTPQKYSPYDLRIHPWSRFHPKENKEKLSCFMKLGTPWPFGFKNRSSSFEFKIWIATKTKWIQGVIHIVFVSQPSQVCYFSCFSCKKWLLCDGCVVCLDRPTRVQMWSGSVVWSMVAGIFGVGTGQERVLWFPQVPSN